MSELIDKARVEDKFLDGRVVRSEFKFEVYYESIKRDPKIRGISKCRCDERLQTKTKEFTRLPYTGFVKFIVVYEDRRKEISPREPSG